MGQCRLTPSFLLLFSEFSETSEYSERTCSKNCGENNGKISAIYFFVSAQMSNFASDLVTASHAVEKGTGCESRAIPLPCVLYNTPTAFISTVSRERPMGRIAGVGTSRKTCQVLNAAKNLARTRGQRTDNRCSRTTQTMVRVADSRCGCAGVYASPALPILYPSYHFSKANCFMGCLTAPMGNNAISSCKLIVLIIS